MRIRMFAVTAVAAVALMLAASQTSKAHGPVCGPVIVAPGYGAGYSVYRPAAYGPYYGGGVSYIQPYGVGYVPAYGSSFSIGYAQPGFSISYSTGAPVYGVTPVYRNNYGGYRYRR